MEIFGSPAEVTANLSEEERAYYVRILASARETAMATLDAMDAAPAAAERAKHVALLAHDAHEGMDAHLEAAFDSTEDGRQALGTIACKKGCHFCCHVNVMVSIPEAFLIASFIRYDGLDGLEAAVKATAPKIAGLTPAERRRKGVFCPLLEDGACGIHELRPNACRAYFSPDAKLCETALESAKRGDLTARVPSLAFPHQIAGAYFGGVTAACGEAGLQNCGVELTAALNLILSDATAMDRWLAGDQVFQEYKKDT